MKRTSLRTAALYLMIIIAYYKKMLKTLAPVLLLETHMKKNLAFVFIVLAILVVWMVLHLAAIRPAFLRWGATVEEAVRVLPADERIPVSGYQCTRALTIDAPPEKVWPWLA